MALILPQKPQLLHPLPPTPWSVPQDNLAPSWAVNQITLSLPSWPVHLGQDT